MKPAEIAQLLPSILRESLTEGGPIAGYLEAMQSLQGPCEDVLDTLATRFDPLSTPDPFVPFLASWVDVNPALARDSISLRTLTARAVELCRWRGTLTGLRLFLESATSVQDFVIEENVTGDDRTPRPFHLRVVASAALQANEALLRRIIEREKPAFVSYELAWSGKP